MDRYVCTICGYVYDPQQGDPDNGVAPGTAWEMCRMIGSARFAGPAKTILKRSSRSAMPTTAASKTTRKADGLAFRP